MEARILAYFEPRCKVCTSPNRQLYERLYYESDGKISWTELSTKASKLGEEISRKAFARHFSSHFSAEVAEFMQGQEEVQEVVEEAKKEVINIVEEIKHNLNGLKALLSTALAKMQTQKLSPTMLRVVTEIYREHRQSLEACERLTSKLTSEQSLSEAELLKLMYLFAKDFCPDCRLKFKNNLDKYLMRKKNE